jgi:hypothetical protein
MEKNNMNIYEKLMNIQNELKAPKNLVNKFGGFNYRSCEDILEALKPLLKKYRCTLKISDEIVNIGNKNYVQSTARLIDLDSENSVDNVAYAREAEEKKGMSEEMLTGSCSSYCRKYCLNGLFLIDDTEDPDSGNVEEQQSDHLKLMQEFNELADETGLNREALYEKLGVKSNGEIPSKKLQELIDSMKKKKGSK